MQAAKLETNLRTCEVCADLSKALEQITAGKNLLTLRKGEKVFSQGEPADAVYLIQAGKVKITSVSSDGREAVFAILGTCAFFGETSLGGHSNWLSSATTVEASKI